MGLAEQNVMVSLSAGELQALKSMFTAYRTIVNQVSGLRAPNEGDMETLQRKLDRPLVQATRDRIGDQVQFGIDNRSRLMEGKGAQEAVLPLRVALGPDPFRAVQGKCHIHRKKVRTDSNRNQGVTPSTFSVSREELRQVL
ncbi:MAG: hypothetical protein C4582_07610 [Desulfobacteraceae bacterium]|nr:MAG: hypothetical protein C4582_07610 [Desulfobacteraceae bacterium]